MWMILFAKRKEQLKQMNFSRKVKIIFEEMKKMNFDKNIVNFLERCSFDNYIQLSIRFSNVYGTLKDFLEAIQGNECAKNK